MRAVVIGGSIGGLFAGLSLQHAGWDVDIYESASHLEGRGAGIVTHQALFDTLKALGISAGEDLGLRINTRKVMALDGSELESWDLSQLVTSWGRLHWLLLSTFPAKNYHNAKTLVRCEQTEQHATAWFNDGDSVSADLLIAADGIRSTVRGQLEPQTQAQYAGYFAWRGLVDESRFTATQLRDIFPYFTFSLPPGEQLLGYPVAGEKHTTVPGNRRYNLVWYRPADAIHSLPNLLTNIDGNNNGSSIAPHKIRPELIQQMQQEACELVCPHHAKLIAQIEQPIIQPIYDVMSTSMVSNRVVFVGDAAYTARPHLGMGVTKAAEDALCLGKCLNINGTNTLNVEDSLQEFAHLREPIGQLIVNRSRALGAYLQSQQRNDSELVAAKKHRSTHAILRETATDEFL